MIQPIQKKIAATPTAVQIHARKIPGNILKDSVWDRYDTLTAIWGYDPSGELIFNMSGTKGTTTTDITRFFSRIATVPCYPPFSSPPVEAVTTGAFIPAAGTDYYLLPTARTDADGSFLYIDIKTSLGPGAALKTMNPVPPKRPGLFDYTK